MPDTSERERLPYIQIDADTWAVMRDSSEHPVALIHRITDHTEVAKFLVLAWHPVPHERRMLSMHDTIEEANRSVRWDNSKSAERARNAVPRVMPDGRLEYNGPGIR